MKRLLLIGSIIILIFTLLSWGVYRLLWTPTGIQWLFNIVSRYSPLTISAEKIDGRITDRLEVDELKVTWATGNIRVKKIETSLEAIHLLRGKIIFKNWSIQQLVWDDRETKTKPLNLSLPRITGLLTKLNLKVETFHLDGFLYNHLKETPFLLKTITARLEWKQGLAAVSDLNLEGDLGRLQGDIGLAFSIPVLWMNVRLFPYQSFQGLNQWILKGRLQSTWPSERLKGKISIRGLMEDRERLLFQTDLEITPYQIFFNQASLRQTNRKGHLGGRGLISLRQSGPDFQAWLNLEGLDLGQETGWPTNLSGKFHLVGGLNDYQGIYEIQNTNKSWQDFRFSGIFRGGKTSLQVSLEKGEWLKGILEGRVEISWVKALSLSGFLKGHRIRTDVIQPQWTGLVNLEAQGNFNRSASGFNQGFIMVNLLESRFQGKTLQGTLTAHIEKNTLTFEKAVINGRGFQIAGHGDLSQRLGFNVRMDDLSTLTEELKGSVSARGWARWQSKRLAGELAFTGEKLFWSGVAIQEIKGEVYLDQEKKNTPFRIKTRLKDFFYRSFAFHSLTGEVGGTLSAMYINLSGRGPQGNVQASLSGRYFSKQWQGTLFSFEVKTPKGEPLTLRSPATLRIGYEQIRFSSIILASKGGEKLSTEAELFFKPFSGSFSMEWQQIDLSRAQPFLKKNFLSGQTTGMVRTEFPGNGYMNLQARAELKGIFQRGDRRVEFSKGEVLLSWNNEGLRSSWELKSSTGARLWGEAVSSEKGRLAFPVSGRIKNSFEGIDLTLLTQNFLSKLHSQGKIMGMLQGEWNKGARFSLAGQLKLGEGSFSWKEKGTTIETHVQTANVGITWIDEHLRGNLNFELEGYGKISGDFDIPLPVKFPIKPESNKRLAVNLQGNLRENGLLTVLFPDALQTSRGKINWNLSAGGTWEKPIFSGNLELSEAGADLLPLGIRVKNVSAKMVFTQNRIELSALEMWSGSGRLLGQGTFWIRDWKISRIEGKLTGNRFQLINRPGMEVRLNPNLNISGAPNNLTLGGVLEIPEALISSGYPQGFKGASPDVILVDQTKPSPQTPYWPIYGEFQLQLGSQVQLKAQGLDTRLQGNLAIHLQTTKDIKALGEIKTVEGHYLLQGQKLDIPRGRFSFNGPVDNPVLDLLALKTVHKGPGVEERMEEIKVGVSVSGTLRNPQVKLYSQPPMSDTDVFSYLLFGEPLKRGENRKNLILMAKAAGSLLGGNTQNKLMEEFNLDTFEIQSEGGDLSSSIVTVGKYLNPRLFLGLGGSLFSSSYQLILRYALTPRIEIETRGGTNSGGNIFYRIEFD